MANDSIELGRIRAKVLKLENKVDDLEISNSNNNITGNLEFARSPETKILFNSDINYGSDKAFILYKQDSAYHVNASNENSRLSIGVYNDNENFVGEGLDLQGAASLIFNVGQWDTELNNIIGGQYNNVLPSAPIKFRINNDTVAAFSSSGRLQVGTDSDLGSSFYGGLSAANKFAVYGDADIVKFGNVPALGQRYARGSAGNPTSVNDGDRIGANFYGGYHSNLNAGNGGWINPCLIASYVDGDTSTTSTAIPGKLSFFTTQINGSRTENLTIKSNGNVGIGTTAPPSKFSVAGSVGNANGITVTSIDVATIITHDVATNGGKIQVKSGGSSTSIGANNYRLLLQPEGGNVGIGTTAPETKLHIYSTDDTRGLKITNSDAGSYAEIHLNASHREYRIGAGGNTAGDSRVSNKFYVYDMTAGAPRITLNSNGYVGIGSQDASVALHVRNGNSYYGNPEDNDLPTIYASNINSTSTSAHALLGTRVNGANAGDPFVSFDILGVRGWSAGIDNSDDDKFKIASSWHDVGTSTRLTIDTAGQVGIGNTTPSDMLDVSGSMTITKGTQEGPSLTFHNTSKTASGLGKKWMIYNMTTPTYQNSLQFWMYDTLACAPGGTCASVMTIADTQRVGIGTTSPGFKLSIAGSTDQYPALLGIYETSHPLSRRAGMQFGNNWVIGQDTAGDGDRNFFFYNGGTGVVPLFISSDNKIGIGTTSPDSKLHVNGGGLAIGQDTSTISSVDGGKNSIQIATDTYYGGVHDDHTGMLMYSTMPGGWGTSQLEFRHSTNWGTYASSPDMVIGDRVGIGTTSPSTKLQVNAKIIDDNSYSYDTNSTMLVHPTPTATATLNDPKTVLLLGRQGTGGQAYGAGAVFNISRYENAGVNSRTRLDISLAHNSFDVNSNTVLTAYSNGNIGIGNTSPLYKLDVSGEIRSTVGFRFPDGTVQTTAGTSPGSNGTVNSGFAGYVAYYPANGNAVSNTAVLYTDGTNLGISTTSVASYKLNVNGGANIASDSFINGIRLGKGNASITSNTALGYGVLGSISTGDFNTAVGKEALKDTTTGQYNTAVGSGAGSSMTIGSGNVAVGLESLFSNNSGSFNVGIGQYSLYNNKTHYNTAIGAGSLQQNTDGGSNVAVGYYSLNKNTIGVSNVAVGYSSLANNISGIANTAVGFNSLGASTGDYNTSIGYASLMSNTSGDNNIAIGANSLQNNTTANDNVAIGANALRSNTVNGNNIAIGKNALEYSVNGIYNIAIGLQSLGTSLFENGRDNTALGHYSLYGNTSGFNNVSVGNESLKLNKTGYYNTAIGFQSCLSNDSGYDNTCVGAESVRANTTGNQNTGIGKQALFNNTTGVENVAIGAYSSANNLSGNYNVAIGKSSLWSNVGSVHNVAIGYYTQFSNTTGQYNTSIGTQASYNTTSGSYNVALGGASLYNNIGGSNNTSIGYLSAYNNKGSGIVAVGYRAAVNNINGLGNTAIGYQSLDANISGLYNTAVGIFALGSNISDYNTAVGSLSLYRMSTGQYNTAVGIASLQYKIDGTNNTSYSNCSGLGYDTRVSADNQVQLGNSSTTTYYYALASRSDLRDKTDIENTKLGLQFINNLRPVDFRWDYRDDYQDEIEIEEKYIDNEIIFSDNVQQIKEVEKTRKIKKLVPVNKDGSRKRSRKHHGFIAQEVKQAIDNLGIDFGGYQDHKIKGGDDVLSLGYTELIAPIVKSIQELSTENDYLKKKLEEKEKQIDDILSRLTALENK